MADYLLITRADGGLSILQLLDPLESYAAELAKWESQADPAWLPVVKTRLVTDPVFPDRATLGRFVRNRAGWVDDGVNIVIDPALLSNLENAAYVDHKSAVQAIFQDGTGKIGRLLRAVAPVMLARVNATDQTLSDLFAAIAAATSLNDLKSRAAVVAASCPPQFTLAQMKTAIVSAINSTDSD